MKKVVVIAGPTGSGKNVLINSILAKYPHCTRLVTATTRPPRPGEREGVDYYFLSNEMFTASIASGDIPEHRYVPALNTYYGIYLPDLNEKFKHYSTIFAQVDIVGAKLLKERFDAVTFFMVPSSIEELQKRLKVRNPEWSEKELEERMKITQQELHNHAPQYDYRVVNADGGLEKAVDEVIEILKKEGYTLD